LKIRVCVYFWLKLCVSRARVRLRVTVTIDTGADI